MMNMSTFIKRRRKEVGLTQEQLAKKMDVSVVSVQNWESGKKGIELKRYTKLASVLKVPVDKLIKEVLIEEDKMRPGMWPDFLFDKSTNDVIDTLHLNLVQQDLFGLLYIYDSEYLKKMEIDFNTLYDDLKRIPYGFIEKLGSIQFMNQVDDLHKVIKYVKVEFLIKVLKQNPDMEFNIKKLPKELICEFIDDGFKRINDTVMESDDPHEYEADDGLFFRISMKKARKILPVLEKGAIHLTDGNWANLPRGDVPEEVLQMCDFEPDLWREGYYKRLNNCAYIRHGLEEVTNYRAVSDKDKEDQWYLEINEKGRKLLKWFTEK